MIKNLNEKRLIRTKTGLPKKIESKSRKKGKRDRTMRINSFEAQENDWPEAVR